MELKVTFCYKQRGRWVKWNPFNGIESAGQGVVAVCDGTVVNPFNGIERAVEHTLPAPNRGESIQWN